MTAQLHSILRPLNCAHMMLYRYPVVLAWKTGTAGFASERALNATLVYFKIYNGYTWGLQLRHAAAAC